MHAGFLLAFSKIKDGIEAIVDAQRRITDQENIRVVVTGHSLGGAVATIMATYLRSKGKQCDLYSYGSPRVGNDKFAEFASSQQSLGFSARITNQADVVTAIPPMFLGYRHVFPEYWYRNGPVDPTKDQVFYDTALREKGISGCRSASECTSASCSRLPLGLLSCNTADHSSAQYTNNFDFCPENGIAGRLAGEMFPKMPPIEDFVRFEEEVEN